MKNTIRLKHKCIPTAFNLDFSSALVNFMRDPDCIFNSGVI